jgi:hypothetical protein
MKPKNKNENVNKKRICAYLRCKMKEFQNHEKKTRNKKRVKNVIEEN